MINLKSPFHDFNFQFYPNSLPALASKTSGNSSVFKIYLVISELNFLIKFKKLSQVAYSYLF